MLKFRITIGAVVAGLVIVTPRASSAQETGRSYYCQAETGYSQGRLPGPPKQRAIYLTAIHPVGGNAFADINEAWIAFAKASFDPYARMYCNISSAEGITAMRTNSAIGYKPNEIIESKWEYSGGMTAIPSKQGGVYGWCMSGHYVSQKTVFATPVFEVPLDDARAGNHPVEITYAAYLKKRYNIATPPSGWQAGGLGCPHNYTSRTQAEGYRQTTEKDWRAKGFSVVETGWNYARNADTPPRAPNSSLSH